MELEGHNNDVGRVNPPRAIGVILDGNRRWARKRGLPDHEGHRQGYENVKNLLKWSQKAGIEYLVIYAFSTENWKRGENESKFIFDLARIFFKKDIEYLHGENIKVLPIGRLSDLPEDVQENAREAVLKTKDNNGVVFVPAISYGGRSEILNAVNKLLEKREESGSITEQEFEKYLWSRVIPEVEVIIRTGGEKRLSNFLTWKSAYSELFFVSAYWPDFSEEDLYNILREYNQRERRMGK